MKRCPQCEFIYEDDQSLCDMDGVLLVFDSRALPNHHALETVPPKGHRRNRAVPAFASVILALVLGGVYYVSTHRAAYTAPATTTTSSAAPVVNIPALVEPTPEPAPTQATEVEVKPAVEKPAAATAPTKKPSTKMVSPSQPKPATVEKKKEDSKVGSILKKTGRILKKPFKF